MLCAMVPYFSPPKLQCKVLPPVSKVNTFIFFSLFLFLRLLSMFLCYAPMLLCCAFFIEIFDWRMIRVHIKLVRLLFMFPMLLSSDIFY
jgi:hypothetical protein